jgi:hypothetical protein
MKTVSAITIFLYLLFISGCATIVGGTDQTLTFNSQPDGATVTVAGRVLGKTPITVSVNKAKNQSLVFNKEGYEPISLQLSTSLDSLFWGNIIIGGFFGSTTDGVSGAMYKFSPDQYFVTLMPSNSGGLSASNPRKIKELVVLFGDNLRMELAGNGGEKTDAILEILQTEENEKLTTMKALKKLADNNEDDLAFANSIIDLYGIN